MTAWPRLDDSRRSVVPRASRPAPVAGTVRWIGTAGRPRRLPGLTASLALHALLALTMLAAGSRVLPRVIEETPIEMVFDPAPDAAPPAAPPASEASTPPNAAPPAPEPAPTESPPQPPDEPPLVAAAPAPPARRAAPVEPPPAESSAPVPAPPPALPVRPPNAAPPVQPPPVESSAPPPPRRRRSNPRRRPPCPPRGGPHPSHAGPSSRPRARPGPPRVRRPSRRPEGQPPAPAPVPAPAPAPAAPAAAVDTGWRGAVSKWLLVHRHYPEQARARGQEGVVGVAFTAAPDGRVLDVTITRSSGFPLLDQSVRDMLAHERLPAFPPGMAQTQVSLSVAIHFTLEP